MTFSSVYGTWSPLYRWPYGRSQASPKQRAPRPTLYQTLHLPYINLKGTSKGTPTLCRGAYDVDGMVPEPRQGIWLAGLGLGGGRGGPSVAAMATRLSTRDHDTYFEPGSNTLDPT